MTKNEQMNEIADELFLQELEASANELLTMDDSANTVETRTTTIKNNGDKKNQREGKR